jgi:hypothetical protein
MDVADVVLLYGIAIHFDLVIALLFNIPTQFHALQWNPYKTDTSGIKDFVVRCTLVFVDHGRL